MKIYTRTGDDGSTGLIGGDRVPKSDARIECYGTVDELNATLGWAIVAAAKDIGLAMGQIQHELFVIGSHLAAPDEVSRSGLPDLDEQIIGRLEMQIDVAQSELPQLRQFILPVAPSACWLISRRIVRCRL